ncbi:hypothetical protein RJ640_018454, partial [Escallonia rubra]
MVDDFMVCVDRIIASACFESVNERERLLRGANGGDVIVVTEKNNVTSSSLNSCNSEGCSRFARRKMMSMTWRSLVPVMALSRQAWGPHIDIRDPHFLAFAAAERQFLQSEYDDYAAANSGTIACFRYVAIILMLILLIRQALMVTRGIGMIQEASTFLNFQISLLQLAGFLLPCYVLGRSWYILQSRRRRQ